MASNITGIFVDFCQSFAWTSSAHWSVGLHVPFSVDVTRTTFEKLDLLLQRVCEGIEGSGDWPPPQEKECMVVAALNLLRLQVNIYRCTTYTFGLESFNKNLYITNFS